jgi:hypothetical protein
MLPPAVLWIDPGLFTGLARLERGIFTVDEREFQAAGDFIVGMTAHYGPMLAVGWERFTIFADTHKYTQQPEAIQIIGVARYHATANRCRILPENEQMTPKANDRRMLESIGWWVPGKNDAQSAANHMLVWLLRQGELPPRERAMLNQAV